MSISFCGRFSKPCDIAIAGFTIFSLNIAVPHKHSTRAFLYLYAMLKMLLNCTNPTFDFLAGFYFGMHIESSIAISITL